MSWVSLLYIDCVYCDCVRLLVYRKDIDMLRIGLTGGIAAGKSTVSHHLGKLGAKIIDYDSIAHEVMQADGMAVPMIRKAFGGKAVDSSGAVDRNWLAEQVFAHPEKRQELNEITHPLIFLKAADYEKPWLQSREVVVHDIPLLADVYDEIPFSFSSIITVEASENIRVSRMVNERHMSRSQAVERIKSQVSRQQREALADVVLDASVDLEQMFDSVDKLYVELQQRSLHEEDR